MKILITGEFPETALENLKAVKRFDVHYSPHILQPDLEREIADSDCLIVRTETQVTEKLLTFAKRLKLVCRPGIGLDNIDLKSCARKNIPVKNTPLANRISTAEFALALIFSLSKKINEADRSMKAGLWERKNLRGIEISGKTLGLIGLGNIGSYVATLAQSLGMKVLAFDPYISDTRFKKFKTEKTQLASLLKRSDFISLHVPLTTKTKGMVSTAFLKKMKRDGFLINTSRGAVVDSLALVKSLKSGQIGGAALDVFETEPLPADSRLRSLRNLILTPHEAGQSIEALDRMCAEAVALVKDFF